MIRLRHQLPDEVRTAAVGPGEKALAGAVTADGRVVVGTRDALYVDAQRIPWEIVERADWDKDEATLTVSEVGSWGRERPAHALPLEEPGRLLELVRERVTASIVLQRHVPIHGKRGVIVIGRRAPRGHQPVEWVYEFDEGVDPDDPEVRRRAEVALAAARDEVGPGAH
ncbi:hypothetical protein ncot_12465 [Nocardioides sp. JQ2195]|uniref:hypothetical protein n=1 Tax=Nocardioides sp. JQ2195 TaxID=2592334 RepID=UPI00143EB99E|nr:hypothetical protein [Nocardioides sp. JQ2195]QIX27323.1 hypothetical protein ncot_12465 [Nocardioides sp. JQ2195]